MIDYDAEIERIAGGSPGKVAFRALCALIGRAGNPPELVALCEEQLASWPDAEREAPWSWLAALEAGYSRPGWPLARSLAPNPLQCGTADVALPDPRIHPEVRNVARIDIGWFGRDRLAALIETIDHWDGLRSVDACVLTDRDNDLVERFAGLPAVADLESLCLADVRDDMWHFGKPRFRPAAGRPWRLRHAGLRSPDLVHLLRSGLVPDLRSADVLVCDEEEARDLADCAEIARLDRLAIGFRCGKNGRQPLWKPYFGNVIEQDDTACAAFFAHADLASLRSLTVRGNSMGLGREGLGARGVEAIIASGVLRQLTELTLQLLPVGDAVIAEVVGGIDRDRIEKLTLSDLVATDLTASAFAAAGDFPRMRHLDLSRNRLGEAGARQLAADVRMPVLEHLDLSGRPGGSPYYARPDVQPVGDSGIEAWASSDNAENITYLNVAATGLGAGGLAALMRSERLQKLDTLDLSYNPLVGWPAALAGAPAWHTLRTLDIAECGLGDDDTAALTAATAAPRLRSISLAYNSVGSQGAQALASWAVLPQLWELNLHENIIGDDGLAVLAASRAAQMLLELDLEQDCWNARARNPGTPLPAEVTDHASFPSLDAMFLGIIDEYHGARYSSGFPARMRADIASASTTRPELAAFLTHLDMEEPDDPDPDDADDPGTGEPDDPEWEGRGADYDFRAGRAERHMEYLNEARDFARRMMEGEIGWPPPATAVQRTPLSLASVVVHAAGVVGSSPEMAAAVKSSDKTAAPGQGDTAAWAAGRAGGSVVAMVGDYQDRVPMPAAALGAGGPVVSRIGLGLAALGRPAYITSGREQDLPDRSVAGMRARAFSVLDAAYAAGVRYVDAARSYGLAEEFLAGWLAGRGHADVTVGSKWGYRYTGGWRLDAPQQEVKEHSLAMFTTQLAQSRALLGERLALYQVHSLTLDSGLFTDAPLLAALSRLRAGGVIIGLSTSGPHQAETIRRALSLTVDGQQLFTAAQVTWNLLEPSAGPAAAEAAAAGWAVLVKEAVANGRLTAAGGPPAPLTALAAARGVTEDAIALAAALAQPWASVVLSGAVTRAQLGENLAALSVGQVPALGLAETPDAYWAQRAARPWH